MSSEQILRMYTTASRPTGTDRRVGYLVDYVSLWRIIYCDTITFNWNSNGITKERVVYVKVWGFLYVIWINTDGHLRQLLGLLTQMGL